MNDSDLIARAKNGDTAAFETLIEAYQSKVYNLAYKMLYNREDAADAAQDALIKIYKSLGAFQGKSKFSTWVYRLTYNICIDALRRRRTETIPIDDALADGGANPAGEAERRERVREIYRAISGLSPDHRAAVVLRDIDGHSYDEIAEILDCSVGTVKSRISRARDRLKEILYEYSEQNGGGNRQKNQKGGMRNEIHL
ncbi:MAG: RNA polymerase sigma factor [Clostridiales bacterium]|nr:RNA polymerase sigma factor [Clostridiales bacterium]